MKDDAVIRPWPETIPVLDRFADVTDASQYAPLPDDWCLGLSDVVDSTTAIEQGRYRAVNFAGAGTISAVSNALGGHLPLFAFGGDGARFAVAPEQARTASRALSSVASWSERELNLDLRVGMIDVASVRSAGFDVRAAFWQASDTVRYAMFAGGGFEWAEAQLKGGAIGLASHDIADDPDLTGLSCRWGPIRPRRGNIVSLIVKRGPDATDVRFTDVASAVIDVLEGSPDLNPVPAEGPAVRWPWKAIGLQARSAGGRLPALLRYLNVLISTASSWVLFRLGVPIRGFDPNEYRREIAANTDFRKFDDALMMTVDCPDESVDRLRAILDAAATENIVRYGLHVQDEALMTCIVPSILAPDHMHFVDGAGGGYAAAARQLRQRAHFGAG